MPWKTACSAVWVLSGSKRLIILSILFCIHTTPHLLLKPSYVFFLHIMLLFNTGFRAQWLVSWSMVQWWNRHSPQLPWSQLHSVGSWGQEVDSSQNAQPPCGHPRMVPVKKCLSKSYWLNVLQFCVILREFQSFYAGRFNDTHIVLNSWQAGLWYQHIIDFK